MIKEYSVLKDGNNNISEHFKIKEFACKDGTDYLKIDYDLIPILERFRQYVESPVIINSGYRTLVHNQKIGGSKNSFHLYGRALDIPVLKTYKYLTTPELMARFFYTLKVKGIITYNWGVHIDTRQSIYHSVFISEKINIPLYNNVKKGDISNEVGVIQFLLKQLNYNLEVDCNFGKVTETCVLHFQDVNKLKRDGIVGQETYKKLLTK